MRFNGKKYEEIMQEKNMTKEEVCYKTGLHITSLNFILENGFASKDAMERLADAVEENIGDLILPGITNDENCIEFIRDQKRATVTFTQGRYKTRIKELAAKYPEKCQIVAENKDGSLVAHIPVKWVRINPEMNLTDEQRERQAERARNNFHKDNS